MAMHFIDEIGASLAVRRVPSFRRLRISSVRELNSPQLATADITQVRSRIVCGFARLYRSRADRPCASGAPGPRFFATMKAIA